MQSFKENQRVQVHSTGGYIRYLGKTSFAPGDWIGVELDTPTGKNDGSVQGIRYFTCQNSGSQGGGHHGVFVRPSAIRVVPTLTKQARQTQTSNGDAGASHRAQSSLDEVRDDPGSSSMPPPKLPTKLSVKGELNRRSSSRQSRSSSAGLVQHNGNEQHSSEDTSTYPSDKLGEPRWTDEGNIQEVAIASIPVPKTPQSNVITSSRRSSVSDFSVSKDINEQSEDDSTTDWKRKAERLKAKLLLMDKKRMADRDKIATVDQLSQEKYRLEQLVQSLQLKYQHLKGEVSDARQELRSAIEDIKNKETTIQEQIEVIESLTLDKEFADESNEALNLEIVSLKQQLEELLLLKELRDEMGESRMNNNGSMDQDADANAQDILRWQKKSEKLEVALINLRDLSMAEDSAAKSRIKTLEDQVQKFNKEQQDIISLSRQFQKSKDTIEDLQQRLDAAVGAEEMVEKLIEENLMLGERVQDLQHNVDELEVLKDINDELESSHIMTERQLNEQIDFQEGELRNVERKLQSLTESSSDYEQAIVRYKELLSCLQNDLESLKVSNQISVAEKEALNARSKEITDTNVKLQASVTKSQAKAIDTALEHLTTEESLEKLDIVKDFLPPEIFDHSGFSSTFCIKRVKFKARLAYELIMESYSTVLPGDLISLLPTIHAILQSLYISCDNYTFYLNSCSENDFDKCSESDKVFNRIESRLDETLLLIKTRNLNPLVMVQELQQSCQVASGIALDETKNDPLYGTFQSRLIIDECLQSFSVSLILLEVLYKQILTEEYPIESHVTWSNEIEQVMRASRISSTNLDNLNNRIEKLLKENRVQLPTDTVENCQAIKQIASRIESFSLACVNNYFSSTAEFGSSHLDSDHCISVIKEAIQQSFGEQYGGDLHMPAKAVNECMALISNLNSALNTDQLIHDNSIDKPSEKPWDKKIASIKNAKAASAESEALVSGLREQLKEVLTQLKVKDKQLDETNLKREMLESQISKSKDLSLEFDKLEKKFQETEKTEQRLSKEVSNLKKDLRSKIHQLDQLSGEVQQTEKRKQALTTNALYMDKSVVTKIDNLNKTISYLHAELWRQKRKNGSSSSIEDTNLSWLVIRPESHGHSLVSKPYIETLQMTRNFRNLVANTRLNDIQLTKNWMPQTAKNSTKLSNWIHDYNNLRQEMLRCGNEIDESKSCLR